MTDPIRIYQPQLEVKLHKLVQRSTTAGSTPVSERFTGSAKDRVIDLAPFLGDGSAVRTSKSIRQPAGGWQLDLVDRPDGDVGSYETLYGLIEPMDMIEIRMRHGAPSSAASMPIIMRGYVTDVRRGESVSGDGRPVRKVIVSGQDYGKIWQVIQIIYLVGYMVGQSYISGFSLFEQYGIPNVVTPKELVDQVISKIINPYLDRLMPSNSQMPREVKADITVGDATVSPGIQNQQGTIYELLRYYGDVGPWNELFMEDREDGVCVVYRPNPFLKADGSGEKIQPEAPDPVYNDVPIEDIVSLTVGRSDGDVANFYWVASPRFNLVADVYRRQEATASGDKTVDLSTYQNTSTTIYGNRLMQLETQQGGPSMSTHSTGGKAADVDKAGASANDWMNKRRQVVVDSNKDNIVLESGAISMRGNEAIKPGTYIRLKRGDLTAIYYAVQVDHEFIPFQGYFTNVTVERGTGFVERLKLGSSPYFQEQNKPGVSL